MSLTSRRHLAYGTIKNDPQWNDNMVLHSDREPTSDESSWEDYEAASDDFEIISNEGRPVVPLTAFEYHIRNVAICGKEISSLGSGTDGRNSDIGDIADFSSDEEESKVEQIAGCRIPGCQCEEGIDVMKWNYDDLSESEDSEWEDPGQRSIRESVERYNLDLFEGMTPMTYTPPPRKNRPGRKLYQCKPDQPVADGPVGQSFTTRPVGPRGMVSKCEPDDPLADSPVGSTETHDPVDQMERPIQIDIMKIVTTDEPASLVGTPPSSDSGIHSWGEQWENMSNRYGNKTKRKAEHLYPNGAAC